MLVILIWSLTQNKHWGARGNSWSNIGFCYTHAYSIYTVIHKKCGTTFVIITQWIPSASKLFTYLFCMWRKYDVTVTTLTSCDSGCCMRGEAWSSRWLMTQLTNGNTLACLCLCQWWTFWTYLVTASLFSLYLMNFRFHTTLDAVANILRVHYKSMKCDVSFSQGSVSTLFI